MSKIKQINIIERRTSRRLVASEVIPQSVTRLASGQEVQLINIALNGGILVSSKTMLSCGSIVQLKLSTQETAMILEGKVQRCKVVGLKRAKIQYEAAILLDEKFLQLLSEILKPSRAENRSEESCTQELHPHKAELWILSEATA